MNPPRLISIHGEAFGSFVAGFDLELPESGLVLLRGENLDTKGSSASGKSTLIHALNLPLGTCPVPLTEHQSWYTKDPPRVVAKYSVGEKIVEIARGKKFELTIDGVPARGGAPQKEAKITELFGIDSEMILALTYRGQRKPGLFLDKTDSEKKEFLTALLRLDKFEAEEKKSKAKVAELESRCLVLNARIHDISARLETLRALGSGEEAVASLERTAKEIQEHESAQRRYEKTFKDKHNDADIVYQFAIDLFAPKLAAADANIQELERFLVVAPPMTPAWEKLKALQVEAQTRLDRLEKEDGEKARDLLLQLEDMRAQWQALAMQARGSHKLLADRDRVVADMKQLVENKCPTCLREWEEALVRLEDLKVELGQINSEVEELKYVQEEADRLKSEYDALPKTIEPNPMIARLRAMVENCQQDARVEELRATEGANSKIQENADALREARAARKALLEESYVVATKKRNEVLAGSHGLEVLALQEKEQKVKKELVRQKLAEEVGAIRERERQIAQLTLQAGETMVELEPLQTELAAEKDFAHLTGREAFRGSVFDEALEAISAETNDMLGSIANTRNCTLEFESERETQEGKLRQEIVPVITINGHKKGRPSGGMLSAIELAVDLAVGKIVSERTGVCPGWLILDESFDGLGPREKETCLEILQTYARDRLVIVVDHMSETQGLFTHRITVQSQNGISVLQ